MQSLASLKQKELFFARAKTLDPTYRGSRSAPVLNLRRKCVGVCISATKRINIAFLWEVLQTCRRTCPPMRYNNTIGPKAHNCVVQAVVVESSKHLFDEEGFRQNTSRQRIQKKVDHMQQKKKDRFEKKSVRSRIHASLYSVQRAARAHNRTSTTCLVLTAIVREGVIRRGMHFVADQSEGQVDYLMDYWGNVLDYATPGMAVTLIDARSTSGCPGVGTHVLSMVSESERMRVYNYRRMLQWYLECFPKRLELLRPRGMDVTFAHLGDYGQLQRTTSLESQLLYGPPPPSPGGQLAGSAVVKSLGAYLQEKNEQEADHRSNALMTRDGTVGRHALATKRVEQAVLPKADAGTIERLWSSLQPHERIESQEAYDRFMADCIKVGVLLKVDSWHSARMLQREMLRLGTRRVAFQTMGVRFGGLQVEDITFFGQAIKVILCYRVPQNDSTEVDRYVETSDVWVLYADHFADVLAFMKWCAVTLHKTEAGDSAETENTKRNYMVTNRAPTPKAVEEEEDEATEGTRRWNRKREGQRLLIFNEQE
ncbi:translation initiation factor IF-2 [Strigomonas culicis]|uniref:Translation initiation factor IF-2 n=1 Tax=Strigomonas culicis TaxID=28005 RepID=S9TVB1_9TRYP|nr:translation initiation factor IF-2 [Strigomonas culicis]EPY25626.1 translation initiation factor IF-2 [Strigomonas culicis]|eukprot:EPY20494.1 translation initiation factor IF-2 [Strigomonas culicis]